MDLRGFRIVVASAFAVTLMLVPASPQSSSCTTAIVSLSPCLNYITDKDATPSGLCCQQLAKVVLSEPQCLCMVINGGGSSLGITINRTRALALPAACSVQTPPVSRCNASAGPAQSPGTLIAPSGSKTVPATSDGITTFELNILVIFGLLVISAYFSATTTA